jgi:pantoate--beta-alanine ligase
MGALHAGHMSLIRRAAAECDVAAVTDYVNPLQFAPTEDLSAYPRDVSRDCELAGEAGAQLLFAPDSQEMWREPSVTTVHVRGLTDTMEGRSRPGHFDGVTTIVTKLLVLAGRCRAYFGEKDYQQLAIIRRLVDDLALPVEVIACPTVRDTDGLALSSRNSYLTPEERSIAPHLYYALLAGKHAVEDDSVSDPELVAKVMVDSLRPREGFTLDYAEVAEPEELTRPVAIEGEVRLLIAARLGRARLIDNVAATPPVLTD